MSNKNKRDNTIVLFIFIILGIIGCTNYCNWDTHEIRAEAYRRIAYFLPTSISDVKKEYKWDITWENHEWLGDHHRIRMDVHIKGIKINNINKEIYLQYSIYYDIDWCADYIKNTLILTDTRIHNMRYIELK